MNLHVVMIYFPAGVLVLSVVLDLIAHATGRRNLADAAWWALVGGMAFLLLALVTGIVESTGRNDPAAQGILGVHGTLAYVSTILFAVLALWRLAGRGRIAERWRPAYLASAVIASILLLVTVYTGTRSVYGYGVGIPVDVMESAVEQRSEPLPADDDPFEMPEDTAADTADTTTFDRE